MDNNLEYTIKILDQYGKPLEAFNKGIDTSSKKVKGLDDALSRTQRKKSPYDTHNRSLAQLRQNLSRYKTASENSFRADHIRRYKVLIDETNKKIRQLEKSTETCTTKTEGFFSKIKDNFGIGKGLVFGAIVGKVAQFGTQQSMEAVKSASEVEKYQVTLKTMLGTADKARDRMQEYFDIAKKTPFDLPQVVEAGNKLQALGRYSRDNVTMLGDLAAAAGKPMEQAMSAFSKLASGQKGIAVDMFRDLMITTDDWTAATGKGISKSGELLATTEELIAALPQIMKSKGFFGMMANQAETTEGKVANLGDAIFQLRAALGEKLQPAYNKVVETTSQAVEKLTKIIEIPLERKIAAEKIELNALVEALTDANIKADNRNSIIEKIQQKYPDFIKNIDIEKASTQQLREELEKTNIEYDKKIRLASYSRRREKLEDELEQSGVNIIDYEMSLEASRMRNEAKNKLKDFLLQKGFKDSGSIIYSIDNDGNVIATTKNKEGLSLKRKALTQLSEEDKTTAIGYYSDMTEADKMIKIGAGKKLEKEKEEYEKYKSKINVLDKLYNRENADYYTELLTRANSVNLSDKKTVKNMFGSGENSAESQKLFETLRGTSVEQMNDKIAAQLENLLKGSKKSVYIPTPGAGTNNTSNSTLDKVNGQQTSISSGGTRNTDVTINIGSMIETMTFQNGLKENKEELENQLTQILSRVLGMAAVS